MKTKCILGTNHTNSTKNNPPIRQHCCFQDLLTSVNVSLSETCFRVGTVHSCGKKQYADYIKLAYSSVLAASVVQVC